MANALYMNEVSMQTMITIICYLIPVLIICCLTYGVVAYFKEENFNPRLIDKYPLHEQNTTDIKMETNETNEKEVDDK